MHRQDANVTVVRQDDRDRAVAFLHGFSGTRDDTWDKFPTLLGTQVPDCDIFTIGYATTLLPDVVGVWAADPDLPILATMLRTQLAIAPFQKYKSLTLIAHSMGGLVVQRALVDDPNLGARVKHLMLFGTPSGGLRKAGWLQFWKRQLNNMAEGSPFIGKLRREWVERFGKKPPFELVVVAGASDQFVPPKSSLEPFDPGCQRVVAGDHLSIVKPAGADSPSLSLVAAILSTGVAPPADATAQLNLAAECSSPNATTLVGKLEGANRPMTVKEIVNSALALERAGKREDSIKLLERHRKLGTDVQGTLAGRIKRLWLESEDPHYAAQAMSLYQGALDQALQANDHEQIYYQAINVAFLKFVVYDQPQEARQLAELAVKHAELSGESVWTVATLAEANLYFGRLDQAVALYGKLLTMKTEAWQQASAALQASRIAGKLEDRKLAERLEALFTPGARRVNKIFVSYSHKDKTWVERLSTVAKPYLRNAEAELDLWVDTRIKAGDQWDPAIQKALAQAGVAVVLVSADFLASEYVLDKELPVILEAAKDGKLRLLWVYLSAAGWDQTALKDFQATHDTKKPLVALPSAEQDEILKSVAERIKEAALGATERFVDSARGN